MCFRPAEIAKSRVCSECEGVVNAVGGFLPPKCPYCGFVFPENDSVTSMPTAPKAPVAPSKPRMPDIGSKG